MAVTPDIADLAPAGSQPSQREPRSAVPLQSIIDSVSESIVGIGFDWRCTFANRRAHEMLHADVLVGANLWDRFPGNREEPFASNYLRAMHEREEVQFEAYYPKPLDISFRVTARPYDEGIVITSEDMTLRRKAELDRDSAAHSLQQVMDVTADSVISLDRDYMVTFANRSAERVLSPAGDLLGRVLWSVFPDADPIFRENYDIALNQRRPVSFEAHYPAPLNLWFSVEALPAEDGIIVFFRDITQRRTDEEKLRASEERYRVLADLNPQFIWMGSATGHILYVNQAILDYIGPQRAGEDSRFLHAIVAEDRTRLVSAWQHAMATGEEFNLEVRLVHHVDSTVRWFHLRARPVCDENGSVLQWLGVGVDIDERRAFAETVQHQRQLSEQRNAELEAMYNASPVGLGLFDPVEFRYLRVSDRLAEIIGLPREQILGRRISDVAKVDGIIQLFEKVASGQPVINQIAEGELPGQPGIRRVFNLNYFPVFDEEGKVVAITTASLEITAMRRTEAALVQSEKLAAVGRLASSISHEINNPLEAITNLLYLVSIDEHLLPDTKLYVHMAQSELARVSQIATQTLRFHRQAVGPTRVTAAELLDAVLNLYQGRLTNSGIQVQRRYVTAEPILCLENDIRQVLNNLIANAIDAMRRGGRLIVRAHNATVRLPDRDEEVQGVRITVADTGHGMEEATRLRIFEPFFTTKDLNGTGLGLWISSGIVQRHHGRLTVRSSTHPVHHGTAFSLFLPIDESPMAE
jgi:PAS domain S-box-containing protein